MADLFAVGTCRHVARMSKSKEAVQLQRASPLERVTYRFFMIPKEVQMIYYNMRSKGLRSSADEWSTMVTEAIKLQEQEKVLYVQPYNPSAVDEGKRPFVLIIQDPWMLHSAIRFSPQRAWAVDSTFKTNVFGLPLYAAVVPNQMGVGIPVLINMRDHVYSSLSNLMHTPTEEVFEERFNHLIQHYSEHSNVQRYITNGWCGRTSEWQERWPKFGRLFPHGNVDTTNLVERLWQYIKYTLLDAKINRPILSLLRALIGDSNTGTYMGGTLMEFLKQKQEIANSGRYSKSGSSKCHIARLAAGEKILRRYMADSSTVDVVDECSPLFRMQSLSISTTWYHLSLQSSYCDCPDWTSECKHLYGLRLIVEACFPHLSQVLPIIVDVHALENSSNEASTHTSVAILEHENEEVQTLASTLDGKIADYIMAIRSVLNDVEASFPKHIVKDK
ncbi:hypothetical protein L7F22_033539 [Adiantum nelumboides]|nr:hypothetical protein [Adiantum nelumboides]